MMQRRGVEGVKGVGRRDILTDLAGERQWGGGERETETEKGAEGIMGVGSRDILTDLVGRREHRHTVNMVNK